MKSNPFDEVAYKAIPAMIVVRQEIRSV